jgi:hypothetical protein
VNIEMRRQQLIEDLAADLTPVRSPGRTARVTALWLVAAMFYTTIIIFVSGPMRPGGFGNLIAYPMFGVETLIAAVSIVALAIATLRSAIPSPGHPLLRIAPAIGLSLLWLAFYVVGLWQPAHPVSTLGVRDHCILQGLFFGVPNMALMLYYARSLMPLSPRLTGALAGAAAAAIPAAWMQLACMYMPSHILSHHLPPIIELAVAGALLGPFVLDRAHAVPRSRGEPIH